MCIYELELPAACHPEKFGEHRHYALSKTSYKYILTLKNQVGWIITRRQKMSQTQKWYLLRRSAQKLKYIYFFPYDYFL